MSSFNNYLPYQPNIYQPPGQLPAPMASFDSYIPNYEAGNWNSGANQQNYTQVVRNNGLAVPSGKCRNHHTNPFVQENPLNYPADNSSPQGYVDNYPADNSSPQEYVNNYPIDNSPPQEYMDKYPVDNSPNQGYVDNYPADNPSPQEYPVNYTPDVSVPFYVNVGSSSNNSSGSCDNSVASSDPDYQFSSPESSFQDNSPQSLFNLPDNFLEFGNYPSDTDSNTSYEQKTTAVQRFRNKHKILEKEIGLLRNSYCEKREHVKQLNEALRSQLQQLADRNIPLSAEQWRFVDTVYFELPQI